MCHTSLNSYRKFHHYCLFALFLKTVIQLCDTDTSIEQYWVYSTLISFRSYENNVCTVLTANKIKIAIFWNTLINKLIKQFQLLNFKTDSKQNALVIILAQFGSLVFSEESLNEFASRRKIRMSRFYFLCIPELGTRFFLSRYRCSRSLGKSIKRYFRIHHTLSRIFVGWIACRPSPLLSKVCNSLFCLYSRQTKCDPPTSS